MARAGRKHVEQQGADIWMGGFSVTCTEVFSNLKILFLIFNCIYLHHLCYL